MCLLFDLNFIFYYNKSVLNGKFQSAQNVECGEKGMLNHSPTYLLVREKRSLQNFITNNQDKFIDTNRTSIKDTNKIKASSLCYHG